MNKRVVKPPPKVNPLTNPIPSSYSSPPSHSHNNHILPQPSSSYSHQQGGFPSASTGYGDVESIGSTAGYGNDKYQHLSPPRQSHQSYQPQQSKLDKSIDDRSYYHHLDYSVNKLKDVYDGDIYDPPMTKPPSVIHSPPRQSHSINNTYNDNPRLSYQSSQAQNERNNFDADVEMAMRQIEADMKKYINIDSLNSPRNETVIPSHTQSPRDKDYSTLMKEDNMVSPRRANGALQTLYGYPDDRRNLKAAKVAEYNMLLEKQMEEKNRLKREKFFAMPNENMHPQHQLDKSVNGKVYISQNDFVNTEPPYHEGRRLGYDSMLSPSSPKEVARHRLIDDVYGSSVRTSSEKKKIAQKEQQLALQQQIEEKRLQKEFEKKKELEYDMKFDPSYKPRTPSKFDHGSRGMEQDNGYYLGEPSVYEGNSHLHSTNSHSPSKVNPARNRLIEDVYGSKGIVVEDTTQSEIAKKRNAQREQQLALQRQIDEKNRQKEAEKKAAEEYDKKYDPEYVQQKKESPSLHSPENNVNNKKDVTSSQEKKKNAQREHQLALQRQIDEKNRQKESEKKAAEDFDKKYDPEYQHRESQSVSELNGYNQKDSSQGSPLSPSKGEARRRLLHDVYGGELSASSNKNDALKEKRRNQQEQRTALELQMKENETQREKVKNLNKEIQFEHVNQTPPRRQKRNGNAEVDKESRNNAVGGRPSHMTSIDEEMPQNDYSNSKVRRAPRPPTSEPMLAAETTYVPLSYGFDDSIFLNPVPDVDFQDVDFEDVALVDWQRRNGYRTKRGITPQYNDRRTTNQQSELVGTDSLLLALGVADCPPPVPSNKDRERSGDLLERSLGGQSLLTYVGNRTPSIGSRGRNNGSREMPNSPLSNLIQESEKNLRIKPTYSRYDGRVNSNSQSEALDELIERTNFRISNDRLIDSGAWKNLDLTTNRNDLVTLQRKDNQDLGNQDYTLNSNKWQGTSQPPQDDASYYASEEYYNQYYDQQQAAYQDYNYNQQDFAYSAYDQPASVYQDQEQDQSNPVENPNEDLDTKDTKLYSQRLMELALDSPSEGGGDSRLGSARSSEGVGSASRQTRSRRGSANTNRQKWNVDRGAVEETKDALKILRPLDTWDADEEDDEPISIKPVNNDDTNDFNKNRQDYESDEDNRIHQSYENFMQPTDDIYA